MPPMAVPPDVNSVPICTLGAHAMAAMLLNREYAVSGFANVKLKVNRRQCVECGCRIGEGRAGRTCKECRNKQELTRI